MDVDHWLTLSPRLKSMVPCVEFTAIVKEFEEWTKLLLLDALQRSGFLTADSKALSLAELQSRVPAGYMRFMAEATELLKMSGNTTCLQNRHLLEMCHLVLASERQWDYCGQSSHLRVKGSGVSIFAGYIETSSGGKLVLSAQACTESGLEALKTLQQTGKRLMQGPGASIVTNIKLVSACMQALPRILAGNHSPPLDAV